MPEPKVLLRYKWGSAYEWLQDYSRREMNPDQTRATMLGFAAELGDESIQGEFQSEMDKDGFFEPLNPEEESGEADHGD